MSKNTSDRGFSDASSLQADLSNLVIWAHSHGTICNQIPSLAFVQNMGHLSDGSTVVWMCTVGHAYHWHCGNLHDRGEEETEAVGRRKRLLSSESLARESKFEEKRFKLTPSSFEMGQADSGSTGLCGRSQGISGRKPVPSISAEEKYLPKFDTRVQTGEEDEKSKSDKDIQLISDEEKHEADEDNQGDRISQENVSEPSVEELEMPHCQTRALHQPAASQRAACAPTARSPVSDSEDLSTNILKLGPFTATGPTAETSRSKSLLGSETPKVCFKSLPILSAKARAQLESQPSVILFEFQAAADVQQHLQLSPPKCSTPRMGSSRDGAENVSEDSDTSRQTPCSSAFQSPESHPPAASNEDVLKKQKKTNSTGDIEVFKEWLKLHHPSETRKIHTLPPADLDHYLVSFFSSAKRQNGMDFSSNSLNFFQHNISRFLKDHNYPYNILRGPEFRASQEAYKLNHWCLFLKEEGWSVVENMTDDDVENLSKKGILSKTHPQGLLHLMFTSLIRGFGASTHYQAHQLYWGQVVLRKTKGELEYLEWKDDLSPKGDKEELCPRLFAKPEDPENCPVASYKEYARKRPPDMLKDNHPLYLFPKSLCSVWDEVWYSRKALTKPKIYKILKVITQEVKKTERKTRKLVCPFGFAPSSSPKLV
ncbi:uncharacterized protein KIAA1958-like isoform X1 [Poecile atricapillus]|uniref:uncharacterized protein KIAA1958-like isoform X1 n=2 Tax=Poecile atricapillus TaxID=48891 RepID=UPI0027381F2B|nr:uncharacterized protein KIAA1958-like isoform X1 [Poecile atricapillus]XP_058714785.1 uncharacterized protein KIAA1958-like isoform X1 [Poecile atricapillus]XP_058714786.1 uncharacterized protein KIAA1958-like isoform X1 [Poecile atricapillus]XP_058714787.1 uncharacterized protein KIAA1958-like isoform X1 [Poecile atricapillus]XP_058714788.1 uncharacterized protein KIAA1958-like isoform X1 [Poecile atricapillus]XP_058714789.1 uncharacterized protein KIAA1958-like isoform X1 [Poecile atricap